MVLPEQGDMRSNLQMTIHPVVYHIKRKMNLVRGSSSFFPSLSYDCRTKLDALLEWEKYDELHGFSAIISGFSG